MRASYRALTCGAVTVLALLALCALCAIFLTNRYTGRLSCAPVSLAITGAQARERTDPPYRHLLLRCLRQGHDTAYGQERTVFGTTPARQSATRRDRLPGDRLVLSCASVRHRTIRSKGTFVPFFLNEHDFTCGLDSRLRSGFSLAPRSALADQMEPPRRTNHCPRFCGS